MLLQPDLDFGIGRTEAPLEQLPRSTAATQERLSLGIERTVRLHLRILRARVIDLLAVGSIGTTRAKAQSPASRRCCTRNTTFRPRSCSDARRKTFMIAFRAALPAGGV